MSDFKQVETSNPNGEERPVFAASQEHEPLLTPYSAEAHEIKNHKVRNRIIVGAGAVAVAIGAGIFVIANNANHDGGNNPNAAPQPDDKQTSDTQNTPSAETSPSSQPSASPETSTETAANSIEISASLSPKEMGKKFVETDLANWRMAGASPAFYNKYLSGNDNPDTISKKTAATESTKYTDILFTSDWQSNSDTVDFEQFMEGQNAHALRLYLGTAKEAVPFEETIVANKIVASNQTADAVTLTITLTLSNNSDANNAAQFDPAVSSDNNEVSMINVTLNKVGDSMKIAEISQHAVTGY